MDTNQENGVSLDELADSIEDRQDEETLAESTDEEVAETDQSEEVEDGEELVETEFEGKAYKVPKELKDALLRNADYTRKTQEVAETRKTLELQAQQLQQKEQVMTATFEKAVELRDLKNKLSQYEKIDWTNLVSSDPVEATRLNIAYQQLQREASQKEQELVQFAKDSEQLAEQERQQLLSRSREELLRRVPNFTPELSQKITESGKRYGFSDQELAAVFDPRYVHVLHDAMKWQALQAQKPQALKKVVEAPRAIKPQAQQPKPKTNQAAFERLKQRGRVEDLAAFL